MTRIYDPETQCCTEGGIAQKYPIEDADYYPRCEKTRVKRAGREPSGTGFCGPEGGPRAADGFGRANFLPHCQAHDDCYDTCRSDRERCDEVFCNRLLNACRNAYPQVKRRKGPKRRACESMARDYCEAVVTFGSIAYTAAQRKACQCCP